MNFFPDLIIGWNSKVLFTILLFNLSKRHISTLAARILNQEHRFKNILVWQAGKPDFVLLGGKRNILRSLANCKIYINEMLFNVVKNAERNRDRKNR